MPRPLHKLTASAVKAAKGTERPYTLADGGGLVLLVQPDGGRFWRFRYRYQGTAKMLSFGGYPDVSLAAAREQLQTARSDLAAGIDPSAKRKAERRAPAGDSFQTVAEEFLANQRDVEQSTLETARRRLDLYVFPKIGKKPIGSVTAPDLLAALRIIEKRSAIETAHRTRALCGRVFRYAIATGRAKHDVSDGLKGALAKTKKRGFAAITDAAGFAELLLAIDRYHGQPVTRFALKLLALTFVRPGELRQARWPEFMLDGDEPQWVIPPERMKGRREHIVPLASQTIALLRELKRFTSSDLVFPSLRPTRPLSENTLNMALRSIGYSGDMHVAHGFRKSASTLLHERGYDDAVIETQLAHTRPGVGGIYNRAHLLEQRRTLMQAWADYLDELLKDDALPESDLL